MHACKALGPLDHLHYQGWQWSEQRMLLDCARLTRLVHGMKERGGERWRKVGKWFTWSSGWKVRMDITWPAPPAENLQRIHVISELGHHNYYHYCHSDSEHADLEPQHCWFSLCLCFLCITKRRRRRRERKKKRRKRGRWKQNKNSNSWSFRTPSGRLRKMILRFDRCSDPGRKALDPDTNSNTTENERKAYHMG